MVDSDVRDRAAGAHRRSGLVFDLIPAKLRRPPVRSGAIRRSSLIERLAQTSPPIVTVVAPAGYGKTTLLAQWAERNGQSFAWVHVDERDNDPSHTLTGIEAISALIRRVGARSPELLPSLSVVSPIDVGRCDRRPRA